MQLDKKLARYFILTRYFIQQLYCMNRVCHALNSRTSILQVIKILGCPGNLNVERSE